MNREIGSTLWAIAEGYIPPASAGSGRELESHETVCILNSGDADTHVELTVYFADREPAGTYRLTVPARRTRHLRFNDLSEPEAIPRGTDCATYPTVAT